jgi:hypothetical protein
MTGRERMELWLQLSTYAAGAAPGLVPSGGLLPAQRDRVTAPDDLIC